MEYLEEEDLDYVAIGAAILGRANASKSPALYQDRHYPIQL